ncbi:transporter [Sulfurirhabdus autotrophica]|uniref:Outer membrane beta-barrel porin/alpha-amylase n=1 Tax=Sulfurirhabdus autotrophica TaxID=1706046 RepID=A0A4R3Y0K9_9PROT|nr:transporter [Sulfurirhabdus autotrophica]TCV85160.1 hypothetical protein EDC63_11049 [Sulfurirhabdus autotrophica]
MKVQGSSFVVCGMFVLVHTLAHASCGSAACAINTQWEQGIQPPGIAVDLRYEYIKQDQLREGASKTLKGAGEALEKQTTNRNLVTTLDYMLDANWSFALSAPIVSRDHTHVLNDTQETESWNFSKLGDVLVTGRYQPSVEAFQNFRYGFKFGVKLPTGSTDIVNSEGAKAERALQPGTGSTDALLGAFVHQALPNTSGGWFVQAVWQHAITTYDNFTPGDRIAIDLGLNYPLSEKWGVLLQLNALHKNRDAGTNAEPDLSGGTYVFVSPGLSYALGPHSQVYGFIQKPVYQYVNGVQLTADLTAVIGVRHHF